MAFSWFLHIRSKISVIPIPIQIASSELNTARFYTTVRNVLLREMFWTASTIWAQKNEILVHHTHVLHKAVDGTEHIQFRSTERNCKMTGRVTLRAESQHRRFSLQWSQQKECVLYDASAVFPVPTLTHRPMFRKDLFYKNCNVHITTGTDIYKQISPDISPREYNLQTCSANPRVKQWLLTI